MELRATGILALLALALSLVAGATTLAQRQLGFEVFATKDYPIHPLRTFYNYVVGYVHVGALTELVAVNMYTDERVSLGYAE